MSFSSLNPYQQMVAIKGRTPEELIANIAKVLTPLKIVQIVSLPNGSQVAYCTGDVRIKKQKVE